MAPVESQHLCSGPFQYYECPSNGFFGCCTQDACHLSWCPDFVKPPLNEIFWPFGPSPAYAPTTIGLSLQPEAGHIASTIKTSAEPFPSPDSNDETNTLPLTEQGYYTATEIQQVYVVYQTSAVLVTPPALKPTVITRTVTTVTPTSIHTSIIQHTTSIEAYTTSRPSNHTEVVTSISAASPKISFLTNQKNVAIIVTFGSVVAVVLCFVIIKFWGQWDLRRMIRWMRRSQHDDHPLLAGTDANSAGARLSAIFAQKNQCNRISPLDKNMTDA